MDEVHRIDVTVTVKIERRDTNECSRNYPRDTGSNRCFHSAKLPGDDDLAVGLILKRIDRMAGTIRQKQTVNNSVWC